MKPADTSAPTNERETSLSQGILIVSALAQAEACAGMLARELGLPAETAATRKAALIALRRREYAVVIVDDSMAEADPDGSDLLWKNSGLAVPLQINFAICGGSRLARDIRAALARRAQEHALALRAAACTLEGELKSTLTGLLLQSQLALAEPSLTAKLKDKLTMIAEMANSLRQRLQ